MKVFILGLNSESFSANVFLTEKEEEMFYKIEFDDRRMTDRFGMIELIKGHKFWKIPVTSDIDTISIAFRLIEAITNAETTSE